jgi:hypothetical protein
VLCKTQGVSIDNLAASLGCCSELASPIDTMSDHKQVVASDEKQHAFASEVEGSGISSPAEYDDLPDPDVGKTDAERAALVRPLPSLNSNLC